MLPDVDLWFAYIMRGFVQQQHLQLKNVIVVILQILKVLRVVTFISTKLKMLTFATSDESSLKIPPHLD